MSLVGLWAMRKRDPSLTSLLLNWPLSPEMNPLPLSHTIGSGPSMRPARTGGVLGSFARSKDGTAAEVGLQPDQPQVCRADVRALWPYLAQSTMPLHGYGHQIFCGPGSGIRELHWALAQWVSDLTTQLEEGQALTIMVQAKQGLSEVVVARCLQTEGFQVLDVKQVTPCAFLVQVMECQLLKEVLHGGHLDVANPNSSPGPSMVRLFFSPP